MLNNLLDISNILLNFYNIHQDRMHILLHLATIFYNLVKYFQLMYIFH